MKTLLLTNDDGARSPALLPTYRALAPLFDEVTIIVPHIERSWIGKAVTRRDEIEAGSLTIDGVTVNTTTGYPADCVQIGMFNLLDSPPDLVVSGINIGANHGSAYSFGSGTIGAAIEAALTGVPGIAISASSGEDNWAEWNAFMRTAESVSTWEGLAAVAAEVVAKVRSNGFPEAVDVLNVNLPEGADATTAHRVAPMAYTNYGQLFDEHRPGVYRHDWNAEITSRGEAGAFAGTDVDLVFGGSVSITPFRLPMIAADLGNLAETFNKN